MKKDRVGKISNAPYDDVPVFGRPSYKKPYIPIDNKFIQKILVVKEEDVTRLYELTGTYNFGASFLSPVINGKVLVLTYNPANYLYL